MSTTACDVASAYDLRGGLHAVEAADGWIPRRRAIASPDLRIAREVAATEGEAVERRAVVVASEAEGRYASRREREPRNERRHCREVALLVGSEGRHDAVVALVRGVGARCAVAREGRCRSH